MFGDLCFPHPTAVVFVFVQSLQDQGQGQPEMPRGRKRSEDQLDAQFRHNNAKRHRTSQHHTRSVPAPYRVDHEPQRASLMSERPALPSLSRLFGVEFMAC